VIAEYATYYGAPPAPSLPWPLVLACTDHVGRVEARRKLTSLGALDLALGSLFAKEGSDGGRLEREQLVRAAYPVKGQALQYMENLAAPPEPEEGADG
jgi:hypothetical protein